MFLERGRNAVETPEGGFSADAGVDHSVVELVVLDALFQQRHPAFALRQAIAGGNAVAQYENGLGGVDCRDRYHNEQQKEQNRAHG